ncbi:MAG: hypothetical protein LBG83_00455 [Oscillospiraceae bacterium]|jgi:hypothetical protein|nr:hypothetical protein [Oscillospiraceae bacterium]
MDNCDRDVIAALLKIVREHALIPEGAYHAAVEKLNCTFDGAPALRYDREKTGKGAQSHGYSQSAG